MYAGPMEIHNVAESVTIDGVARWCRIPDAVRRDMNELAQTTAFCSSGVEIRFRMTSDTVVLKLNIANWGEISAGAVVAEVFHGCFASPELHFLTDALSEIVIHKPAMSVLHAIAEEEQSPFNPELVRVLLPRDIHVVGIEAVGDLQPPQPGDQPKLRMLSYGSSITHGSCSGVPSSAYVNRLAERLGADAINLGFPGSGMLDEAISHYMAARSDWDFATLELGINVKWDYLAARPVPADVFQAKLNSFMPAFALRNRDRWIFCTDIFAIGGDYDGDPLLVPYREAVKATVRELDMPRLIYVEARSLMPATGLSTDLIHPSSRGMQHIADSFAERIQSIMQERARM